ncbi:MAG TPA: 4'-phosphopantetheinyl transferase superfamily protein, partial [Candidatus Eisenbacteria bacterium]|nr:4'-phosphopantetheinyl transferase superfamily protein [Candidatus Eisenbacteria bacterium]
AELERCGGGARAARFTELWTLKESYVKATGAGILRGLDECAFTFGASSLRFNLGDTAQADAWRFALFEVLDYRLAVAVRDPAHSLITLRIHEAVGDDRRTGIEARLLRMSRKVGVACGA